MSIYSIGKSRESLNFTSEEYKKYIRKYMESMGFCQMTDSFVEGHRSDMIFVNPKLSIDKLFYVESKATRLTVNNQDFARELLEYFVEWLNLNDYKFNLYLFVKQLANKKDFSKLFENYDDAYIKKWVNKHKKRLPIDKQKIIEKANDNDILKFFSQVILYEGDIEKLRSAIEKKKTDSILSIDRQAKKLLQETQRRIKPIQQKNILFTNLVSFSPPTVFFMGHSKVKTRKEIFQYFENAGKAIPPFTIDPESQYLYTFCPLDSNNNLTEIIDGKIMQDYFNESRDPRFRIWLINEHFKRMFFKKGLRRVSDSSIYFFECFKDGDRYNDRTCPNYTGDEKVVSHPYYKLDKDGKETSELNFIYHHAANISPKIIWNKYYARIIPVKIYTNDGHTPIEGLSKDIIDRLFRTSLYNRSQNKLYEIKFWAYHLFQSMNYTDPEPWFSDFKFNDILKINFNWSPITTKEGQSLLGEFTNAE